MRDCLPRLDLYPARLAGVSGGLAALRYLGTFRPPSFGCAPPLQQVFDAALHLPGTPGGGVPDLVAAIAVCLALLSGIPELEAQTLRAVLQPPADQLLGGGLDLLFHGLGAGVFLFDLLDALSPPHGAGTPERPGPVPYAADISDGRVVIS